MPTPALIAIVISDLHLSLLKPACRADKDWMAVQAGYLKQVRDLAREEGVPVLCAGDIFDRWNPPPELINFALKHLPDGMIAIPGNHDLPTHRTDLMHRSAYGVLKEAGKIIDLSDGKPYIAERFVAFGFGWGAEISSLKERINKTPHIAIVHKYLAPNKERAFHGAPKECFLGGELEKVLRTYDTVVIGDNHLRWSL